MKFQKNITFLLYLFILNHDLSIVYINPESYLDSLILHNDITGIVLIFDAFNFFLIMSFITNKINGRIFKKPIMNFLDNENQLVCLKRQNKMEDLHF